MRLGIYIPDKLYGHLQRVGGTYNFSAVCRAALQELVDAHDRAEAIIGAEGVEHMTDRYKLADEVISVHWGRLGTEHAVQWMAVAGPEEFEHLLHRLETLKRQDRNDWEVPIPQVRGNRQVEDFGQCYLREQERLYQCYGDALYEREDYLRTFDRARAEREFMQAWLAYALTARKAIHKRNHTRTGGDSGDSAGRLHP